VSKIIIVGNIVDGVILVGPFIDGESAVIFAAEECREQPWTVAPLTEPEVYRGKPAGDHLINELIGDLTSDDAEALWDLANDQDPIDDDAHASTRRQAEFCARIWRLLRSRA